MSYLVGWSAITVVIIAVPITFTTRTMLRLFRKNSKDKWVVFIERFSAPDEVESKLPSNVINAKSLL